MNPVFFVVCYSVKINTGYLNHFETYYDTLSCIFIAILFEKDTQNLKICIFQRKYISQDTFFQILGISFPDSCFKDTLAKITGQTYSLPSRRNLLFSILHLPTNLDQLPNHLFPVASGHIKGIISLSVTVFDMENLFIAVRVRCCPAHMTALATFQLYRQIFVGLTGNSCNG